MTGRRLACLALLALLCANAAGAEPEDAALARVDAWIEAEPIDEDDALWRLKLERPPPRLEFDPARRYLWKLDTSEGLLVLRLRPEWAPNHVANAIYLTRLGFYDGLVFHRVIPGFMAQAGDPLGTGQGGPGYRLDGEFPRDRKARHRGRGVLSAANSGPGTDGSQFFITFRSQPSLNGDHTVYGELVQGKDALRAIEKLGTRKGEPRREIAIYSATVSAK